MEVKMEEKRIKHYLSTHKILLVGEGDFSFALSLAKAFGSASNIIATSLDSKDLVKESYNRAPRNLRKLKKFGCTIVHQVNVHTMNCHSLLQNELFDRIVFNFPHAGFQRKENIPSQIREHQNVVRGFLNSAREMVRQDGEIHITHKTTPPFCNWEIVELAKEAGLFLMEEVPFKIKDYPGYINKRGDGYFCDRRFHVGECSTFKFTKLQRQRGISGRIDSESLVPTPPVEVLVEMGMRILVGEFRQSIEPKQAEKLDIVEHESVEPFCSKCYSNSLSCRHHNFSDEDYYDLGAVNDSAELHKSKGKVRLHTPVEVNISESETESETETETKATNKWFWATASLFSAIVVALVFQDSRT